MNALVRQTIAVSSVDTRALFVGLDGPFLVTMICGAGVHLSQFAVGSAKDRITLVCGLFHTIAHRLFEPLAGSLHLGN